MIRKLIKQSRQQHQNIESSMENYFANIAAKKEFESLVLVSFPSPMTSVLQPVNVNTGRSYKCVFEHFLVRHIPD